MNFGSFLGGGLPMPPMPPGLPNPFGGGGGGMVGGMGGGSDLNGMLPAQGGTGPGGAAQTDDSGYQQNLAGLLQMLGANQNQPRTTTISGGGLI